MHTELLAQIVEELSIRNARHGYKKPRTIPRPDYVRGRGDQGVPARPGESARADNPYRRLMNRLMASQPSRPGRGDRQ